MYIYSMFSIQFNGLKKKSRQIAGYLGGILSRVWVGVLNMQGWGIEN